MDMRSARRVPRSMRRLRMDDAGVKFGCVGDEVRGVREKLVVHRIYLAVAHCFHLRQVAPNGAGILSQPAAGAVDEIDYDLRLQIHDGFLADFAIPDLGGRRHALIARDLDQIRQEAALRHRIKVVQRSGSSIHNQQHSAARKVSGAGPDNIEARMHARGKLASLRRVSRGVADQFDGGLIPKKL